MFGRRRILVLLLAMLLSLATVARPAALAQTPATEPAGLDVVRTAYNAIEDLFYRPVDPRDLLNAGWNAVASPVHAADAAAPQTLGALPAGRDAAFAAFSAIYVGVLARGKLPAQLAPPNLAYAFVDGMARSLKERHTNFLPPALYRGLLASLGAGGQQSGSGMRWTANAPYIVTAVAPGGPAERAGVQAGDVIAAIDGKPPVQTGLLMLLYPDLFGIAPGESTALSLDRGGHRLELTLTSGAYAFPVLESRLLPGGAAYLRLDQFVQSGAPLPDGSLLLDAFDRRLDELEAQGARGLILDLRGNSGGSAATATELLGRFLPEDALTDVGFDERGHEATGIVSGQMRRTQLPMVVLVDGGSASASEETAAALHDEHRALLVGTRTAGALASSLLVPLSPDAGLQVAVLEILTARGRVKIDGAGVPVDAEVQDTRTSDDYRTGRDPQLDAAVAALPSAPAPPAFRSTPSGLGSDQVHTLLAPYAPEPARIPPNDRLQSVTITGSRDLNHVNQAIGQSRDPLALQQQLRSRGWLGSHVQSYGANPFLPPAVTVSITVYATAAGATAAVAANDDELLQPLPPPLQLGDQTAAHAGIGPVQGTRSITWRRGSTVFGVAYSDLPGFERSDVIAAVAQQVDAAYLANPLPPDAATRLLPAQAAAPAATTPTAAAPAAASPAATTAASSAVASPEAAPSVASAPATSVATVTPVAAAAEAHPAPSKSPSRVPLVIAIAAVLAVVAGGVVLLRR